MNTPERSRLWRGVGYAFLIEGVLAVILAGFLCAGCASPTAPHSDAAKPCLAPYIWYGYIHWCPKGSPQPQGDSSHLPVPGRPAVDVCDSVCLAHIGGKNP